MAKRTMVAFLILIFLGFLIVSVIILNYGKLPPIKPPFPEGEAVWFVKHIACAAAMCNGKPVNNNICQSNEVIAVGRINESKTCRELCEERGAGSSKRCGPKYAISFTFSDNTIVDSEQLQRFSHFYGDIIHIACFKCAGGGKLYPAVRISSFVPAITDVMPITYKFVSVGKEVINFFGADKCSIGAPEFAGSVWIEKNTYKDICNYDEKRGVTYCIFEKDKKFWIWGEYGFSKKWKEGGWADFFWGFGQTMKDLLGGWIPGWERCGWMLGDSHDCPKVVVLPSDKGSPSDCPS